MEFIEGQYFRDLLGQPAALRKAAERLTIDARLESIASELRAGKFKRVVLTGMGSSFYALYPLFIGLTCAGLPALMLETSELVGQMKSLLGPHTLIIAVSQSGKSVEIVRLIELAGQSKIVSVTNAENSPLWAKSNAGLLINAGPESSVACKTYLNTLLILIWLEAVFTGVHFAHVQHQLAIAPDCVESYIAQWRRHLATLNGLLQAVRHVFVVGRGRSLAAAGTGGLIIKEAAHFPAEGLSSAAFRHGPFELVSRNVFVLVFAGDAGNAPLNRKLVKDIQSAGGLAALVDRNTEKGVFCLPDAPELLRPIMEILPVQMMTLSLASLAGREAGKFVLASKITTSE